MLYVVYITATLAHRTHAHDPWVRTVISHTWLHLAGEMVCTRVQEEESWTLVSMLASSEPLKLDVFVRAKQYQQSARHPLSMTSATVSTCFFPVLQCHNPHSPRVPFVSADVCVTANFVSSTPNPH